MKARQRPIPRPAIDVDVSEIGPGRFMAVARGLGITVTGVNAEHDMALALKRAGLPDGPMATWRGDPARLAAIKACQWWRGQPRSREAMGKGMH
ncbi:MAG: hypothetical protein ACT4OG_06400 [Alphaproteobacteria bacterium]